MTWNVNSWTQNNKTLRENIIVNMSCDIVCLNETHLSGNDIIDVSGYTWFGFNRQTRHVKATKTSGGVGILIKDSCFENFHVRIIDRNFDGVLGMGLCKPPDHSVIWLKVNIFSYGVKETESILSENTQSNDVRIHNVDSTVPSSRYFERYNLHKNSDRCMNNESWRLALNDVINHINNAKRCQNDIDDLYDLLCRNIYQVLDKFYKKFDVRKPTRKRYRKTKPYWDSELNELWQSMCFAEKIFVKFKGSSLTKKQLQREFVAARNIFDKNLRKKERAYRREKINEIDSLNSKNPNEFWNRVNNLLPSQRKKLPDRVKRGADFVTDRLDVLDTWGEDLKKTV